MPETDSGWQVILVGIFAKFAMSIRRRLFMSMARSLAMKKSAPRIGSVTSATWNSWLKKNFPFAPCFDEGAVGSHQGVGLRVCLLVGGRCWKDGEVGTAVDKVGEACTAVPDRHRAFLLVAHGRDFGWASVVISRGVGGWD